MALMIVLKLSSNKIRFDDSFAISVVFNPIAIPIDDYFNAGASFTPSPVIAMI